jgi:hypothetical protein
MLSEDRLTQKFNAAMSEQEESDDPEAARDRLARSLAKAVIEEIKEVKISYTNGLTAPNGAVGGTFNHSVS